MNPFKALILAGVITLAVGSAWPQHGQPGMRPGEGGATGPGLTPVPASGDPYEDATACWNFDDPTDMGLENCGPTAALDLTLVNTPTATGGALGYGTDFELDSSQRATMTNNASVSLGSGVSYGMAGWMRPEGLASDYTLVASQGGATFNADGEFLVRVSADQKIRCYLHDGTARVDTSGAVVVADTRIFVTCRHNATTNKLEAGWNGSWTGSATSTTGDGADTANPFEVGAQGSGSEYMDGIIGPVLWYRSASGGEVLTDAIATSLYNSGKGKTCADLTDAEKVNLVSCWEMSEDGGPYADSIGSNTLTAVNTPTQAAGLVERSDSGMGVQVTDADSSELTQSTEFAKNATSGFTLSWWQFVNTYNGTDTTFGETYTAHSWKVAVYADRNVRFYYTGDAAKNVFLTKPSANEWHLFTAWWDPADGLAHGRTDGNSDVVSAAGASSVISQNLTTEFFIGNGVSDSVFDNIAIWQRVLTSAERDGLWAAGAGDFYAAYWDAYFADDPIRFAWSQMPEIRRIR